MPHQKSLKSLFIEIVVFVSMFALLGHLSMNFWERFIIQKELSNMRTSLHSLKDTINRIGFAYDNLHQELTGLAKKTENEQNVAPSVAVLLSKEAETQHQQCNKPQSLDRRKLHDIKVQAMINARNRTTLTNPILYNNKSAQIFIQDKRSPATQRFVLRENKSVSTITRYPLKSTGTDKINTSCNDDDCYHTNYDTKSNNHWCRKEHERFNSYNNWKF